jgi:Domain of unknown function (DUF4202)
MPMTVPVGPARLREAIDALDRLNADDPRSEMSGGVPRPREVVYAERLSACLLRLYPDASETLQLAARAQHLCRWQIPRDRYPLGREGYNAWRGACREHHVGLMTGVLRTCGYADAEIAEAAKFIRKQELKRDPGSQALENAVGVVFIEHELAAFVSTHADYDDGKLLDILRKTMRKLDPVGHAAIRALDLPAPIKRLVDAAMV